LELKLENARAMQGSEALIFLSQSTEFRDHLSKAASLFANEDVWDQDDGFPLEIQLQQWDLSGPYNLEWRMCAIVYEFDHELVGQMYGALLHFSFFLI
jgi:hypothetical protein